MQREQQWKLDPEKNFVLFRHLRAKLINTGRDSERRFLGVFAKIAESDY